MAYRMVRLPMTSNEAEGHFYCPSASAELLLVIILRPRLFCIYWLHRSTAISSGYQLCETALQQSSRQCSLQVPKSILCQRPLEFA